MGGKMSVKKSDGSMKGHTHEQITCVQCPVCVRTTNCTAVCAIQAAPGLV